MADSAPIDTMPEDYGQLSQAQVPLERAAQIFAGKDANGRTPIVVMTVRQTRIPAVLLILALVALGAGIIGPPVLQSPFVLPIALVVVAGLIGLALFRSLRLRIPEGTTALLARAGKYSGTLGAGAHTVPPWVVVSHLVTRREIPFDVPVVDAPTRDNVRATVDALLTFTISDPYKFVYSISADDFDHVFQASCQYTLRSVIRQTGSTEIHDLVRQDWSELKAIISRDVDAYGVMIQRITITYARPPEDFARAEEARQLAIYQREQQAEEYLLAQRRQANAEALDQQRAIAQVERERQELQAHLQQAEMRKEVADLEMQTEELRLSRLAELLERYPRAAEWEWQGQQLEVARSLAGNTRAVVQIGNAGDIARAFTVGQVLQASGSIPDRHTENQDSPEEPAKAAAA